VASIIYIGFAHGHVASVNKSAYVTAKRGLLGRARVLAKEGGARNVRAHVVCPGLAMMTPLIERQLPELARRLGMSEAEVLERKLLKNTVDRNPGTVAEVADPTLFLAAQQSAALSGQSFVRDHGTFMKQGLGMGDARDDFLAYDC